MYHCQSNSVICCRDKSKFSDITEIKLGCFEFNWRVDNVEVISVSKNSNSFFFKYQLEFVFMTNL